MQMGTTKTDSIRPSPSTPQAELDELRRRIKATMARARTGDGRLTGCAADTIQKLARYWATEHDWRKVEAAQRPAQLHHQH
jgi:hypothetical protein